MSAAAPTARRVAVIGAGMAGCAAARELGLRGIAPVLFQRGGRAAIGGRLGTVELRPGLRVDTACVYTAPKSKAFAGVVADLASFHGNVGFAGVWEAGQPVTIPTPGAWAPVPATTTLTPTDSAAAAAAADAAAPPWVIGTPNMVSLAAALLPRSAQLVNHDVGSISAWSGAGAGAGGGEPGRGWRVDDFPEEFDAVVVATPTHPAIELWPGLASQLAPLGGLGPEKARWSLAIAVDTELAVPFRLAFPAESPITLLANVLDGRGKDLVKRPLPYGAKALWVAQSGTEWAADRLDAPPLEVVAELFAELTRLLGPAAPPISSVIGSTAKLWKYGATDHHVPGGCIWDDSNRLGFAGDWCYDGRLEGAFLSGQQVGQRAAAAVAALHR